MTILLQGRQAKPPGPPYFSYEVAIIGGRPTVKQDVPICANLLFIYLVGAVVNQTIFQRNRRKGHLFYLSWLMFGFCMARIVTMVLRIVWATRSTNANLAIAANIFTTIGVLAIYIALLLLALRVFRATHPRLGWSKLVRLTMQVSYVLLGIAITLSISFTVLMFYTLNPTLRSDALWIQRAAVLYMMIFNLMTVIFLLLSWLLPAASDSESFGTGSIKSKLIILGVAMFFTIFIAGFRLGVAWSETRLASDYPWYDSKAAFYVIEFGFEIIVVYLLLVSQFDQRFWVPNGSCKPGDYSRTDRDEPTAEKTSEQDNASGQEKILKQDQA